MRFVILLFFRCWYVVGNCGETGPYWYWQARRAFRRAPWATLVEGRIWCAR
jgi:hypothetical protein